MINHRFTRKLICALSACAVLLGSLPGVFDLPAAAETAYTPEAVYPIKPGDCTINGDDRGKLQMKPTDAVAMQVVLTDDVLTLSANVLTYGKSQNAATLALFRFDTDYDTSLLASPVAEHTFVNFADGADLTFRFSETEPLPKGEYILVLYDLCVPGSNAAGLGVAVKKPHSGQRAYFNGIYAADRSFSVRVDYVGTPSPAFGTPTKPTDVGGIDLAPHMDALLDFRSAAALNAGFGGANQSSVTHESADGEDFAQCRPTANANDPYVFFNFPDTVIKCSEYKFLLMKLRLEANAPKNAQLFYVTDETGLSEAASVRMTYADTTEWQYVILDLGSQAGYKGLFKGVRLDYFQSCEGYGDPTLDLRYIALFTSREAAEAFHDNFEDFKAEDTPSPTPDTPPDYTAYRSSDDPAEAVPGKLTANGQLAYLYRETVYGMDFTKTPEAYMADGRFGFAGLESAIVKDGALYCKAFDRYTFFTREMLGDRYGIRGGMLEMDLTLTSGNAVFTLRQITPNEAFAYSGLRLTLAPNGALTVADRDGFADTADTGVDMTLPHRVTLADRGDTVTLLVDGKAVYTLLWDAVTHTLSTPDGRVSHHSPHLPGAGYASYTADRTRGAVDNVTYTYTDIIPKAAEGNRPMDYSTWVATDDLGRTTPTGETVGDERNKEVGLFYFLIHSDDMGSHHVNDVTRYYLEGGSALVSQTLSSYAGNNGAYWAEPYFGYYSSHDEWVYRKHAYMLDAAGVDFIFLDVSNNVFYIEQATVLFDTWKAIRDEGGHTPQIAFMYGDMPFTLLNGLYTLLEPFYENPDYQELLYRRDGKPLLLGNSDTPRKKAWTVSGTTPQTREQYRAMVESNPALKRFFDDRYLDLLQSSFTVRKCWAWQAGTYDGYWDWLQESPQAIGKSPDGKAEQISVSMGVHAHSSRGRSYVSGDNTYNPDGNFGYTLGTAKYGLFFAEQFEYALEQDVDVVMITGWNEWYAGVQKTSDQNQTSGQTRTPGYYMVDQMSPEYSRDGEPMKIRDGVGFGDNYYYQMVSYIRRFKGLAKAPATVNGGALTVADTAAWSTVAPAFTDTVGDTDLRCATSFTAEYRYINGTARNDLDVAKVTQDATQICFYISTATPLITADDECWMNLYVDADNDPATGWEGFDYLINRRRTDKAVSVERFVEGKWQFETVGEGAYTLGESAMTVTVPKALLGAREGDTLSFQFKWADNARVDGDVMRFMELGDTAPNDRFTFAYLASTNEDERRAVDPGLDTDTDTETDTETAAAPGESDTSAATTSATGKGTGCKSSLSSAVALLLAGAAWVALKRRRE